MKRIQLFVAVTCLVSLTSSASAQFQGAVYLPNTKIKVYAYNNEKTLAWCGGFNNPQIQTADLNNDGRPDLVVYERDLGVRTFINNGTSGSPLYVYSPAYAVNFPFVDNYMIIKDYNCDGIPDLFYQGGTGFAVSKGYYNAQNQLCFTYYKHLFYTDGRGTLVNAFNDIENIPAIVDVDNDGDLDFLAYNIVGGNIDLYKNLRVENGLSCDSIVIGLVDQCWGKFYNNFWESKVLEFSCGDTSKPRITKVTGQGSSICLFDYDGDGDYDMLEGDLSFNKITFLQNGRIQYDATGADSMVSQDTAWQSNGTSVQLASWPAAFNVDLDSDGKKDIIIASNEPNAENYNCIWYYKNESTAGNPSYVFQSDTFLVDKTIDLGTNAYPALFDYNKDGKPDLFIGSDGYYQNNGTLKSRITYYLNTSTPGNPSFTLQTSDLLNIGNYNFAGASPAFGDIDNDGKQDMVLGHTDGTISFFRNIATNDSVQPNWKMTQLALKDTSGATITVNNSASPFIYDINKDGKPDLLIGSFDGGITYYENVSTAPGVLRLKFITSQLGGAKADPTTVYGGTSVPFIGKVDNTGKDYLLLGSNSGRIYRYDGFQNGNVAGQYAMIDSVYSFINNTGYINLHSAPVVGDIDGDGKYEMFVGMTYGGVQLYEQVLYTGVTNVNAGSRNVEVTIYPNPATNRIVIGLNETLKQTAQVSIVNMQGQLLMTTTAAAGLSNIDVSLPGQLPNGMYVCTLDIDGHRYYNKFTIVK